MLKYIIGLLMVLVLAMPVSVSAQDDQSVESREALYQMLAPIALYPDVLLSQVLMASTYPLEIVEADRWIEKNPMLSGDNLDENLKDKDWDASVKALCHEPALLSLMSEKLEQTTRIGNAFLDQQGEVMDVIQELRARAYQDGNLRSNNKQTVTVEGDGTIVIEPANTQIVYVPYYNTRYVYGDWWYPDWPPWYWGPDRLVYGSGIYFWPDVYFTFGFRSYFNWPGRTIIIDAHHHPNFFSRNYNWRTYGGQWIHTPYHRRGIAYSSRSTAQRVEKNTIRYGSQNTVRTTTQNRQEAVRSQPGVKNENLVNSWNNNLSGVRTNSQSSIRSGETVSPWRLENQAAQNRKTETSTENKTQNRNWSITNQLINRSNAESVRSERQSTYTQKPQSGSSSTATETRRTESQKDSVERSSGTAYRNTDKRSLSPSFFRK